MIKRAFGAVLAAFVLPIAAGAALEQPASPLRTPPFTANDSTQRNALGAAASNTDRNTVTRADPPLAAVATAAPAAAAAADGSCPSGMALVDGEYCTEVRHSCKRWLDDESLPFARCAEYEQPARCVGKRVAMRFCIDREEYTAPGAEVPMNYASFVTASKVCKDLGKRVCTESEWNFACEGEEMRPYPYGFNREPKCNQDREDLYVQTPAKRLLKDHREPGSSRPECVSPFGVLNMVGNLDEPVLREIARYNQPFRNGLKGGWWMAGRNRCRPATTAHDDYYQDIQVGVRCCGDTPGAADEPSG